MTENKLTTKSTKVLSTKEKALHLNIDHNAYGVLAEIGGGQEVARAFFQAGGASGTVAKSISAYDKNFSDALYNHNKPGRYVSEDRLQKMLKSEYENVEKTLIKNDGESDKKYFAFADTVEILNFKKTNSSHGWMGVRFEDSDRKNPNNVIIHFRLLENDGLLQQYTLGVLGVNIIYACFHYADYPNQFLRSLMDNLDTDRVDINMVSMKGPDLDYVDNRLLGVQLVKNNMTSAIMFDKDGAVHQPADFLYKKDVIVIRGSFRPITHVGFDMLKASKDYFLNKENGNADSTLVLAEITLNNLMAEGDMDERDFLARVDILNGMGQNVMISNMQYFYRLVDFLNLFKIGQIRLLIGVPILENVFKPFYYKTLKGGILEAFGRLFAENVRIYSYPIVKNGSCKLAKDIEVEDNLKYLFQHLAYNKKIIDLENINKKHGGIFSQKLRDLISANDESWTKMTPDFVVDFIKKNKLFGYE
jgi:hypothetical protein